MSRQIIAITQVTLDGVMQGPGGPDLLLGRRTYDIWIDYWPKQEGPIAAAFGNATKYVVTRKTDPLTWETSKRIGADVVGEVRKLKATDGPPLHVWGSGKLLQTLMGARLVDEHRIWLFPLVLGQGKRLFEEGLPRHELGLFDTRRTAKGVVLNTYRALASGALS